MPLHYNLHNASKAGSKYDLRRIFHGSILKFRPGDAVTFVDNHEYDCPELITSRITPSADMCFQYGNLSDSCSPTCVTDHRIGAQQIGQTLESWVSEIPRPLRTFPFRFSCAHGDSLLTSGAARPSSLSHPDCLLPGRKQFQAASVCADPSLRRGPSVRASPTHTSLSRPLITRPGLFLLRPPARRHPFKSVNARAPRARRYT